MLIEQDANSSYRDYPLYEHSQTGTRKTHQQTNQTGRNETNGPGGWEAKQKSQKSKHRTSRRVCAKSAQLCRLITAGATKTGPLRCQSYLT